MSKRILTGIQPSGTLHIGNYFGAMRPAVTLQDSGNECFYFIANYVVAFIMERIEKALNYYK